MATVRKIFSIRFRDFPSDIVRWGWGRGLNPRSSLPPPYYALCMQVVAVVEGCADLCCTVKYAEKKIEPRRRKAAHEKRSAHTYTHVHSPTTARTAPGNDYLWRLLSEFIDRTGCAPCAREPVAFGWKEIPFLPPEVGPIWRLSLRKCFDPQCQRRQVTVRVSTPRRSVEFLYLLRVYYHRCYYYRCYITLKIQLKILLKFLKILICLFVS